MKNQQVLDEINETSACLTSLAGKRGNHPKDKIVKNINQIRDERTDLVTKVRNVVTKVLKKNN